jgi:hypothetical protein
MSDMGYGTLAGRLLARTFFEKDDRFYTPNVTKHRPPQPQPPLAAAAAAICMCTFRPAVSVG